MCSKNTIWTIGSEFSNLTFEKIDNVDDKFNKFISKWINIMLLRDDDFFKTQLSINEYNEFIEKINIYKNKYGKYNEDISLYFTEYNFSENLTDKLLTIRNHYGIVILFLLAYPYELFDNDIMIFSKELKKIEKIFNLRMLLQEISFDLGCSSYAIGKIYDFLKKVYDLNSIECENLEFIDYSKNVISKIKSLSNKQKFKYDVKELEIIKLIKDKQKNYLPLDFIISNRLLLFFIEEFFKF